MSAYLWQRQVRRKGLAVHAAVGHTILEVHSRTKKMERRWTTSYLHPDVNVALEFANLPVELECIIGPSRWCQEIKKASEVEGIQQQSCVMCILEPSHQVHVSNIPCTCSSSLTVTMHCKSLRYIRLKQSARSNHMHLPGQHQIKGLRG